MYSLTFPMLPQPRLKKDRKYWITLVAVDILAAAVFTPSLGAIWNFVLFGAFQLWPAPWFIYVAAPFLGMWPMLRLANHRQSRWVKTSDRRQLEAAELTYRSRPYKLVGAYRETFLQFVAGDRGGVFRRSTPPFTILHDYWVIDFMFEGVPLGMLIDAKKVLRIEQQTPEVRFSGGSAERISLLAGRFNFGETVTLHAEWLNPPQWSGRRGTSTSERKLRSTN